MIFNNGNSNDNDFGIKMTPNAPSVNEHLEAFRAKNRQVVVEIRKTQRYMDKHELLEETEGLLKDRLMKLKLLKNDLDIEIKRLKQMTARSRNAMTRLENKSRSVLEQGIELLRAYKENKEIPHDS